MNGLRVAAVGLAALLLAGFAAVVGYNAGWTRGGVEAVQALPPTASGEVAPGSPGAAMPMYGPGMYGYGHGWRGYGGHGFGWGPFGLIFPLFGFLFFFFILKLVFFGFWGGRHRGGWGRWEHARAMHDEWHRGAGSSGDGPPSSGAGMSSSGPAATS